MEGSPVLVKVPNFSEPLKGWIVYKTSKYTYVHFSGKDRRIDGFFDNILIKPENETQTQSSNNDKKNHNKETFNLREEKEKMRNIDQIQFGKYVINAWYISPYPISREVRKLYICEYCMKYFNSFQELQTHYAESFENVIPGREIYRCDNISIFEVKGKKQKLFCQCLSLLGKLFIEHKAAYYDVDQFNYYVLCECDEDGAHTAAFYSCESSMIDNVLSCIVVLPPYQKKGYGRLLIDLSYKIASRAGLISGPERPLSDLGHIAYLSYWKDVIMNEILNNMDDPGDLNVLSVKTSITKEDITEALTDLGVLNRPNKTQPLQINYDIVERLRPMYKNVGDKPHIEADKLLWFKKGSFH